MPLSPLHTVVGLTCAGVLALSAPALAQQAPAPTSPATSQPPAGGGAPAPTAPTAPTPASTTPGAQPVAQPVAPQVPQPTTAGPADLRPGARGGSVAGLQRALRKRGIKVKVSGTYDARTRAGVRALQRRIGVRPTGIANAALLKRLGVTVRSVATTPGPEAARGIDGAFAEYPVPEPDDATPSAAGFIWPANGVVSSPFGPRWGRMHEGLDIAAPAGRPIRAAKAGVVMSASPEGAYGNLVVIDHGNGETTRYGHMSAFQVAKGEAVPIGHVIGLVGSTGRSTGNHLHFEIRINGVAMDPRPYL
ncbi:MAG: peptidoglycan DD-metalloendopeptidase family protein [Actinomycetota bacterium]